MDTMESTMDTILVPVVKPIVPIVVKNHTVFILAQRRGDAGFLERAPKISASLRENNPVKKNHWIFCAPTPSTAPKNLSASSHG